MHQLRTLIFLGLSVSGLIQAQNNSEFMEKQVLQTAAAPQAIGPYSQGIGFGNLWFFSGQFALDPETGELKNQSFAVEVEQVLNNIDALLRAAGADWSDILKTSIFLIDMADFVAVNEAYARRFNTAFPARETVAVAKLPRGARVEISVMVGRK